MFSWQNTCFYIFSLEGVDAGWTFYTPYSIQTVWLCYPRFGWCLLDEFAAILAALNFIVSVHKLRAPGQTWGKLPLFVWSIYATNIIQMLATPVIALTLLLLTFERTMGIGIFDAKLGGDPVFFQHFFLVLFTPAVYIMILPAMGIINEVIPVFSRKQIFWVLGNGRSCFWYRYCFVHGFSHVYLRPIRNSKLYLFINNNVCGRTNRY